MIESHAWPGKGLRVMSIAMPEPAQPSPNQLSGRIKEAKAPRGRGNKGGGGHSGSGKPRSPRLNQVLEVGFASLSMIFLCLGSWRYLNGSAPASLSTFLPFGFATTMFFVVKAWHSLSFDQSTLVGLAMMVIGAIFWYLATNASDPTRKSDLKDLGLFLLSGGGGVFVGQRLPSSAKRNDDNEEE
jgi:hypothetical protein